MGAWAANQAKGIRHYPVHRLVPHLIFDRLIERFILVQDTRQIWALGSSCDW